MAAWCRGQPDEGERKEEAATAAPGTTSRRTTTSSAPPTPSLTAATRRRLKGAAALYLLPHCYCCSLLADNQSYPFMDNLQGPELKVLINIASILKNVFSATITTACNILQNTAVTQKQRGAANGISVTLMSLFKGVAPAGTGILFSWTQKHVTGLFLPGDQILFLVISMVAVIGLILTFKPFFSMSNALSRS